jgi:hypothetical protein
MFAASAISLVLFCLTFLSYTNASHLFPIIRVGHAGSMWVVHGRLVYWEGPLRRGNSPRIVIPLWPLLVISACGAFPVFCYSRLPKPEHLCTTCGYDLTGNISGTCPECGAPIK